MTYCLIQQKNNVLCFINISMLQAKGFALSTTLPNVSFFHNIKRNGQKVVLLNLNLKVHRRHIGHFCKEAQKDIFVTFTEGTEGHFCNISAKHLPQKFVNYMDTNHIITIHFTFKRKNQHSCSLLDIKLLEKLRKNT